MNRDIEYYGDSIIKDLISDNISDKIRDISIEKPDSITVREPKRYTYGIAEVEGEYPLIQILPIRETLKTDEPEYRVVYYSFSIEIYEESFDAEKLEQKVGRLVRCVKEILLENFKNTGSVVSVDYPPVYGRDNRLYKTAGITFNLIVKEEVE